MIINIAFYFQEFKDIYIKFLIAFFYITGINAQVNTPLQHNMTNIFERNINQHYPYYSTFFKPFLYAQYLQTTSDDDTLKQKSDNWLIRKWKYEPFIWVDSGTYSLGFDPVFEFYYGQSILNDEKFYYRNVRGLRAFGQLENKLYFETDLYECQSRFPQYISDYVYSSNVVPGMSQARRFGDGGFDYSMASGAISFKITKRLISTFGTGKHFVGDGYRSILLSDNSFVYPYIRLTYVKNRLILNRVFAVTMSDTIPESSYGLREKRLTSFASISYLINHDFEVSFFESYVFLYPNSKVDRKLNWLYFNPVYATNLLNNSHQFSSIVGMNIRLDLFTGWRLYGQVGLNNIHYSHISKDLMAYQIGTRFFNLLNIRNLNIQMELNKAGKQMYDNNEKLLRYTNYNQPLTHPLGNNFTETIIGIYYGYKNWYSNNRFMYSFYGNDDKDLTPITNRYVKELQYTVPFISDGPKTNVNQFMLTIGYIFNSVSWRSIELGYIQREANIKNKSYRSGFYYISFKTNLINQYFDY